MNKTTGTALALIIIIVLAVVAYLIYSNWLLFSSQPTPTPTQTAEPTPTPVSDMIKVTAPQPNQRLDINPVSSARSMVLVAGQARGNWFFEASFPVKILDAYGNVLAQDSIQTSEDWMTTDFVPFAKEVLFDPPSTLTGEIILMKDNPSGLPENDAELRIPVVFDVPATSVKAFFGSETKNPGAMDCSLVYPVNREIAKTTEIARAALMELLAGPTETEKSGAGKYYTNIPSGVKIKSLTIDGGTAEADFDTVLEQGAGGSCRVAAIRSQITETLKQFSTVKNVVISIDGRTEDILQP